MCFNSVIHHVYRVRVYCQNCHENVQLSDIKKCKCETTPNAKSNKVSVNHRPFSGGEAHSLLEGKPHNSATCPNEQNSDETQKPNALPRVGSRFSPSATNTPQQRIPVQLDSTGMFYWVPAPEIVTVVIVSLRV